MIALITLSGEGARIAGTLATHLEETAIFLHDGIPIEEKGERFGSIFELTGRIFNQVKAIVFIAPAGVAVRSIAPHVRDKMTDPAVVVVDVKGRYAISLLGGHEGGANMLSVAIGNILEAEPVITTSTEALKTIIVGVGCRKGCRAGTIIEAVKKAAADAGADMSEVRYIASADIKEREQGLIDAARTLGIPLRFVASGEIRSMAAPCGESALVRETFNLPGVAEPAALLAGRRTSLILPKTIYEGVAVAVARENSL
jgi:cobalt-precorrin 5A hydrolase